MSATPRLQTPSGGFLLPALAPRTPRAFAPAGWTLQCSEYRSRESFPAAADCSHTCRNCPATRGPAQHHLTEDDTSSWRPLIASPTSPSARSRRTFRTCRSTTGPDPGRDAGMRSRFPSARVFGHAPSAHSEHRNRLAGWKRGGTKAGCSYQQQSGLMPVWSISSACARR
jgi:hypothetical protein